MLINIAHASDETTFKTLVDIFIDLIQDSLFYLLLGIIFIYFVWKIIDTFIIHSADEQYRASGRRTIVVTVVVLVIIISVWGIVGLLQRSLSL